MTDRRRCRLSKHKKQTTRSAPSKGTVWGIAIAAVLTVAVVIVLAAALVRGKTPEEPKGLIAELLAWQGASRTVGQEEYDFFYDLAARDNASAGEEELDRLTRERIAEVNARFALGSYLDLCEPYDFAVMEFRMEQENAIRKAKVDNGETVYGATQFDLNTYFSYLDSTLEAEIVNYLVEHADQPMLEQARTYYDAHRSSFEQLVSITYELEENGRTTSETLTSAGMRNIQSADGTLADFLYTAQPGEVLEYQSPDGVPRKATLIDAVYEIPEFDDAASSAVLSWLNVEVMDELYASIAQNAPVVFELNV